MKAKTINVQITRCPRQYESIRLGGEWSVDENETEVEVLDKALQMLNGYYEELTMPKQVFEKAEDSPEKAPASPEQAENSPEKKKLSYGSQSDRDILQAIINKMEREGVTIETVLQYYDLDDACLHCLQLVNAMNK